MTGVQQHTEDWEMLPWKQFERNIFRAQGRVPFGRKKRIYKATLRGDFKRGAPGPRNLQQLPLRSYSARCLAVRRVTQDNRGKRTAGVDGIAKVAPVLRLHMVDLLRNLRQPASPIRRVYIPKRNSPEMRPLGIPIMLAPRGRPEAKFEPNSYGFGCPLGAGRCCHDALEAIYNYIRLKPKLVLDADIAKCVVLLLHRQKCRCGKCALRFRSDDLLEVHHKNRNRAQRAPDNQLSNRELLHGHCHDEVHRELCS